MREQNPPVKFSVVGRYCWIISWKITWEVQEQRWVRGTAEPLSPTGDFSVVIVPSTGKKRYGAYKKTKTSLHFSNTLQSLLDWDSTPWWFSLLKSENTIPNVPLSSPGLLTATEGNSAPGQASLVVSWPFTDCHYPPQPCTMPDCFGMWSKKKYIESAQESFIPSRFFQPQISTNISRRNIR